MKFNKNTNVLIISHFHKRTVSGGGPPQEIRNFFLPLVETISYIEHPFPYSDDHRSSMSIYKNGELQKQIFSLSIEGPDWLYYFIDIFFTFYFCLRFPKRYDICVALDNLNTFSVIPFRKMGIIKQLVFYTIDYTPYRFKNKILNSIYHFTDRMACYNSDTIWVLNPKMISGRKANGVSSKKTAKSVLLPMGANLAEIKLLPFREINRYQIVFVGILLEKQGIQLVLEVLPTIIKEVPKIKLIIVGQGEYKQELERLTQKFGLASYVEFKGFIKDHREVEKILCKSAVGLAPYVPTPDSFTYFADPGKIKLYLGCGLPVVTTKVPKISRVIEAKKAGIIVNYEVKSITDGVVKLLSNEKLYENYRKNAIELSKNYDTNTLIATAVDKIN